MPLPGDSHDHRQAENRDRGSYKRTSESRSQNRSNDRRAPDDERRLDKERKDRPQELRQSEGRRGVLDTLPPPTFPPGSSRGQSRQEPRSDRERPERSARQDDGRQENFQRERHGKQHRDISRDWSEFEHKKQEKREPAKRVESPLKRVDEQPVAASRTPPPSGRTPPPPLAGRTPPVGNRPSNLLLGELRKAGQSLLVSQRAASEQPSPSDDGMEAGEIPAEDNEERKRRHSPSDSDRPGKTMRTGQQSMLTRVFDDVANFKLQEDLDLDSDAPPAIKSSPSISGDDDNELDARYRKQLEAAQHQSDDSDSDDQGDAGKPRVMSRWMNNDAEGAEGGDGQGSGADERNGKEPHSSSEYNSEDEDSQPPSPRTLLNRTYNMLHECRHVDEFEKISRISEGTYGVVYKAREKSTGRLVALKMIKMEKEKDGFPVTSIREINVMLNLMHKNICHVSEIVVSSKDVFMVMELMDHDLKSVMDPGKGKEIRMSRPWSVGDIKNLMLQLLDGVQYMHSNWVLHRDLKTSNILYNSKGELKICDFGLARQYGSPLKPYTHMVVTLWYRAPELLFGTKVYSTAIDVWSVGCIMGELLLGAPLMPGQSEFDQLDKMVSLLGTPNLEVWPGLKDLPNWGKIKLKQLPSQLRSKFQTSYGGGAMLTEAGFDLLSQLLAWDPEKRISCEKAMSHRWFKETPLPQKQELLPTFAPR